MNKVNHHPSSFHQNQLKNLGFEDGKSFKDTIKEARAKALEETLSDRSEESVQDLHVSKKQVNYDFSNFDKKQVISDA